ncbi:VWA domain-containing protein [Magnetospira thiophila]
MSETGFHFADPLWLVLLLVPGLVWLWLRLSANLDNPGRYAAYADKNLLPFLLGTQQREGRGGWQRLWPWVLLWVLSVGAMAGPRWGFEDRQLFRSGIDLVVLLDLSASMDATDVAPSRLARARQEIEDLISQNRHARIGLIAFASLPHVVSPLTEDGAALLRQLPALTTDLVQLKGSRLGEALLRAQQMLSGYPKKSSHHILLISDGDFSDDNGLTTAQELADEGIHIHALGIGTPEGAPVLTPGGQPLHYRGGEAIISKLGEAELRQLAQIGDGLYRAAGFRNTDTTDLLSAVEADAQAERVEGQTVRMWNERFYWPAAAALLLAMPLFRLRRSNARRGDRS